MFFSGVSPSLGRRASPRSVSKALPVPTKGWNTRDNIADMDPKSAVIMDNVFPDSDRVTPRRGYDDHATGMTADINTLMVYEPASGDAEMFAACDGDIFDISSAGAVGAAVVTGKTNDKWQHVNIGTSGGHFLFACNGEDTPQVYNGSAWGNTTLTGPTVTSIVWCNLHQRRLWIGEKDSLVAHYGGTNAITGGFTSFPLYALANKGGYLMGMATWTRDSGSGPDDVAVFVTSEGQAIVYSGTDPSSAETWQLQGVFDIGKPVGRRFYIKAGGDVVMVTQDGFVSLAAVLTLDRSQADKAAISAQINKAVNSAVRDGGNLFGWQPVLYPRGTMLLFNIPIDGTTSHQYVFNTLTSAPCRFKAQNANCWTVFNEELYFGGKDGTVYKADNGTSDNGTAIATDLLPAFNYFGMTGTVKSFKMAEAVFNSDGTVSTALDLNVDFSQTAGATVSSTIDSGAAKWDEALWDTGTWGGAEDIYRAWKSVTGIGRSASLRIRTQSTTARPSLLAINIIFEPGGYIR